MPVIDDQEQWSRRGQVERQPVEAMHNHERPVGRPLGETSGQQRPDRTGRPSQKRFALIQPGGRQAPLKELSRHAEGELLLQLRPARPQDLVALRLGPPASHFHHGRLPETHPALHHQEPALALKQSLDRRQLTLPLQQLHEKQSASYPPWRALRWV